MRDAGLLQLRLSPFASIESRHPQDQTTRKACVAGTAPPKESNKWHRAL
jgi:hypothetical protein